MRRHYVTYTDSQFAPYASLSIRSVVRTQALDQLTIIYPHADGSQGLGALLAQLCRDDDRVRAVPDTSMPATAGGCLATLHPQLYSDILRSTLFETWGPVLWFDADVLMRRDISPLFALEGASIAAAPDMAPMPGDRLWQDLCLAFLASVTSGNQPVVADAEWQPINCGVMLLNSHHIAPQFARGLAHAQRYLAAGQGQRDAEVNGLIARTLGQFAWNYVFARLPAAQRLEPRYNSVPPFDATSREKRAFIGSDPLVVHYVGRTRKETAMAVDFAAWFGPGAGNRGA